MKTTLTIALLATLGLGIAAQGVGILQAALDEELIGAHSC